MRVLYARRVIDKWLIRVVQRRRANRGSRDPSSRRQCQGGELEPDNISSILMRRDSKQLMELEMMPAAEEEHEGSVNGEVCVAEALQ
jgi:hypothetical protein